ncbi:hypothetical protein FB45DRAFT_914733 [Roridomyces roridus]|uniref:Uncharacterized protein n=1 Tax=Roridomyces roridus TaxID=1738132 RepID=A0AAD7BZ70_9AGAR|nr:hypothetical protein FB45DRAFT_914733 [Roridomyces roridus]
MPSTTAFVEAVLAHALRVRDMDIRFPLEDLEVFTTSMPLLRGLTVGPTHYPPAKAHIPGDLQRKLFVDVPRLKDVSQITSLTATLFPYEAVEILPHTTILEICNIDICNPVSSNLPPISTITPIPVRSLRLLLKNSDDYDEDSMQLFFSMLAFPALETLAVSEVFLVRHQGYLQRIAIHHARTDRSVFESAFPGAELWVESLPEL